MKKEGKALLLGAALCLGMFVLLAGGFIWRTSYAKTEVVTSTSEDGQYQLTIYMIGEPEWPFGRTHCRFDLRDGSKRVVKYPFSIRDDGTVASEGNFEISWRTGGVTVTVSGSEQADQTYALHFDGTVEMGES